MSDGAYPSCHLFRIFNVFPRPKVHLCEKSILYCSTLCKLFKRSRDVRRVGMATDWRLSREDQRRARWREQSVPVQCDVGQGWPQEQHSWCFTANFAHHDIFINIMRCCVLAKLRYREHRQCRATRGPENKNDLPTFDGDALACKHIPTERQQVISDNNIPTTTSSPPPPQQQQQEQEQGHQHRFT